jgi:hypothetical protein
MASSSSADVSMPRVSISSASSSLEIDPPPSCRAAAVTIDAQVRINTIGNGRKTLEKIKCDTTASEEFVPDPRD